MLSSLYVEIVNNGTENIIPSTSIITLLVVSSESLRSNYLFEKVLFSSSLTSENDSFFKSLLSFGTDKV